MIPEAEAGHHIFAREGRRLGQQFVDGVAVGRHSNNLADWDPGTSDTCLAVTDVRVDGNPIELHAGTFRHQSTAAFSASRRPRIVL